MGSATGTASEWDICTQFVAPDYSNLSRSASLVRNAPSPPASFHCIVLTLTVDPVGPLDYIPFLRFIRIHASNLNINGHCRISCRGGRGHQHQCVPVTD